MGCYYYICISGFLRTFKLRRGIAVPRFAFEKTSLWQLEDTKNQVIMKKLFVMALMLLSGAAQAQMDVTRFLGIPVDGPKSEMIRRLKEKGFRSNQSDSEILEGEFNGTDVLIYVVTNKNKVCRILVADANSVDEDTIKARFNRLCRQFENNPNYLSYEENQTIPDEEDISFQMSVKSKRYEAAFYQKPTIVDSAATVEKLHPLFLAKYTEEQLAEPTDVIMADLIRISAKYFMEECSKRSVWFMISELLGRYYVSIFYDNEYNRANGEDL